MKSLRRVSAVVLCALDTPEGVETAEQEQFLQSKGCSEMQGYYFYKPMTVGDYEKAIADTEESE